MWGLLFCFIALTAGQQHAGEKPNVVVIMIDDLGYGDLPIYGRNKWNKDYSTPNLDCMAEEGMRFTDWYSAASVCTPSRAALLTGRLPWRSRMTDDLFEVWVTASQRGGMPANEVTLAEALKTAGYMTGMTGKWHLGVNDHSRDDGQYLPYNQGFDYSGLVSVIGNYGVCADPGPNPTPRQIQQIKDYCFFMRGDTVTQRPWVKWELPHRHAREFRHFMQAVDAASTPTSRKPYFWYHSTLSVHTPLFSSWPFNQTHPNNQYQEVVEEMDFGIGLLMSEIKKHDNNTIVFFLSDNGAFYEDFAHQDGTLGHTTSLPLRAGKGTVFEGGYRIPALVWWPGRIKAGSVNSEVATSLDVFPTVLKLAGLPLPPQAVTSNGNSNGNGNNGNGNGNNGNAVPGYNPLDGKDLSAILFGQNQASPWKDKIYPFFCGEFLEAARYNQYKVIWVEQLFSDAGQPTSTDLCDGGFCCPPEAGATGTCSCGNRVGFVTATGELVALDAVRVLDHGNQPLLFDLSVDIHEDHNLAGTQVYNRIVSIANAQRAAYLAQVPANYHTPMEDPPYYDPALQPWCPDGTNNPCDTEPNWWE